MRERGVGMGKRIRGMGEGGDSCEREGKMVLVKGFRGVGGFVFLRLGFFVRMTISSE